MNKEKKMKIRFEQLIFEVTRRCNLCCKHCLRGDAQDIDMTKEVVDNVLSQTKSIGSITFSGGEPVLGIDIIEYIISEIIRRGIPVNGFYVATNGTIISERLALSLLRLHSHLEDDEDFSALEVSVDEFHENESINIHEFGIYRGLSFFNVRSNDYSKPKYILNRGRAFENGIGTRDIKESEPVIEIAGSTCFIYEANIYVNVNGDIINGCDFSYEEQDNLVICNASDDIAQSIINKSKEEKEYA